MKKRYYWSMLSLLLIILLFDAMYIPAHQNMALFFILGAIHLFLYLPLNLLGAYLFFKPIASALEQNSFTEPAFRRIKRLNWYSAWWVFSLGIAYLALMMLMMYLFPPDMGEIKLENMPAALWVSAVPSILYVYAVLPAFITWFIINDFTLDLKTKIFSQFNVNFAAGKKRLGLTLLTSFIILGFFPSILVILELVVTGAGDEYARFSDMKPLQAIMPERIIIFIGMVIAVIFITRSFTKPIYSLMAEINAVKHGDFSQHAPVLTDDEIGTLTSAFNGMVKGLSEREIIRDTFGKYLSKDVADAILGKKINIAGEERTCTIMVTDIADYTTISEASAPADIVKMLNEYFTVMVDIIQKHRGVVNEFIGDSVFAMFNVPLDDPDHAVHAIQAGKEIEQITNSMKFGDNRLLKTRIGINTGVVVAGNVGAAQRLKYSVVGDQVNIAARLEQLNKQYGTHLLVGENTYEIAKDHFNFKLLGEVQLKGKEKLIRVFNVAN
ncbi:adenylate/guanylate cyclase domain-containing protein [Pontibacter sp. E15-1]|uniref:adenylate/guanylate cyclase domain-containing protein n=1 Tax=Pontibacter sp. E15-1 TaxID=2919918 RepID=UPI001F4F8C7B|nr:adenylate/guanylate cyclase domain-containing protein [Pontibacter sp. E15-1]MCJ8164134.1 adenylate/guanylate cyclase domain-containing protein [Pontibacter sp. E15-1]